MNKKILLITLICTGIFIIGCSNNQTTKPISINKASQGSTKSNHNHQIQLLILWMSEMITLPMK